MSALVHYEVTGPTARVTLDSPHNRNALSQALVGDLLAGLAAAAADEAVRVVVVQASGPVFCSGVDLAEASSQGMEAASRRIVELQRAIVALDKPVLARVQGPVRAGGLGIVAAADVALAAEDATFALTEVKLGLAAAIISLTVHHRMHPRAAALATLGGEVFTGAQAAEYGLVTRAVPGAELDAAVDELCTQLATGTPQGLRESKRLLNRDLLARIDSDGEELAALSARLFASEEAKSAMAAFLDRRR